MFELQGRVAWVGGASRGIGQAIAQVFAASGASIVLLGRNSSEMEKVRTSLAATAEQRHACVLADFAEPELLAAAIAAHIAKHGGPQILVNNTGGPPPGPASAARPEEFLVAFRQHLICNQILVQAVLPAMRQARYGRIINVISTSVKQPIPNLGVSNTIRAAVANWAKTLAGELGPDGITVNNVLPGPTRTARLQAIYTARATKSGKSLEQVEKEELATIPLGRFAEPGEIANAVAFLASPAASFITGINLPVDGGRTASL